MEQPVNFGHHIMLKRHWFIEFKKVVLHVWERLDLKQMDPM
jgi:hypothetical protein